tara:strand:+ start:1410 stop:2147 length:738 start_codon:yes stop_codon:yes gene_type:complete
MEAETYTRQQTLQLRTPNAVSVVGVGGIGFWAAVDLAMSGVPQLFLFDPDVLEESNRNRLPVCQSSVGMPKVDVCKDFIQTLRPDCIVVGIQEKFEGVFMDIQLKVSNFILDCTDSPTSQIAIYKETQKVGLAKYVRAGYDGTGMTVTGHVSGWIKPQAERENYTIAPSWVVPAQIVAALAVAKIMKWPDQEVACDVSEIGIAVLQKTEKLTARCNQSGRESEFRTHNGDRFGRTRTGGLANRRG